MEHKCGDTFFLSSTYSVSGIEKTEPKNHSTIKDRGRVILSTSRQHQRSCPFGITNMKLTILNALPTNKITPKLKPTSLPHPIIGESHNDHFDSTTDCALPSLHAEPPGSPLVKLAVASVAGPKSHTSTNSRDTNNPMILTCIVGARIHINVHRFKVDHAADMGLVTYEAPLLPVPGTGVAQCPVHT